MKNFQNTKASTNPERNILMEIIKILEKQKYLSGEEQSIYKYIPQTEDIKVLVGEILIEELSNTIELTTGVSFFLREKILHDKRGREIELTLKESQIFQILISNPCIYFSQESILDMLQDYGKSSPDNINKYIERLRKKLKIFELKEGIETKYKLGYRWNHGVENIENISKSEKIELTQGVFFVISQGVIHGAKEKIHLTNQENNILEKLTKNPGKVFKSDTFGGSVNSIKVQLSGLRKKLNGIQKGLGDNIKNSSGNGYYWE